MPIARQDRPDQPGACADRAANIQWTAPPAAGAEARGHFAGQPDFRRAKRRSGLWPQPGHIVRHSRPCHGNSWQPPAWPSGSLGRNAGGDKGASWVYALSDLPNRMAPGTGPGFAESGLFPLTNKGFLLESHRLSNFVRRVGFSLLTPVGIVLLWVPSPQPAALTGASTRPGRISAPTPRGRANADLP